jgi:hypothetical protein
MRWRLRREVEWRTNKLTKRWVRRGDGVLSALRFATVIRMIYAEEGLLYIFIYIIFLFLFLFILGWGPLRACRNVTGFSCLPCLVSKVLNIYYLQNLKLKIHLKVNL